MSYGLFNKACNIDLHVLVVNLKLYIKLSWARMLRSSINLIRKGALIFERFSIPGSKTRPLSQCNFPYKYHVTFLLLFVNFLQIFTQLLVLNSFLRGLKVRDIGVASLRRWFFWWCAIQKIPYQNCIIVGRGNNLELIELQPKDTATVLN